MAERRMFAKAVTSSARFLTMPPSSRLLYYDLGMAADDDGFVEAFTVMKMTGAADDDLRVLASKGFVRVVKPDELVTYILDWGTNNFIRKDRYSQSIYHELLVQLPEINQWSTSGVPTVDQRSTQVSIGKVSIGKVSIGKDSIGKVSGAAKPRNTRETRFTPPTFDEVAEYVKERGSKVDPQEFIDFYAAKGWKIGKAQMRDWKAACRNAEKWERWERQEAKPKGCYTEEDYLRGLTESEKRFFGLS